jgi:adenine-specific DNA-methyltransferase
MTPDIALAVIERIGTPSENLVVEGDNLPVLATLYPGLRAAVKVLYIDPPYNTGYTNYRYRDRWDGAGDPDRHERWLTFMRPRLELLRALLTVDGAIFVSIDDNELFRLGLLMDEIFGEDNRLGIFCWEKKYGVQNDSRYFSENHEYILCYARDRSKIKIRLLPRTNEMNRRYTNRDNDPRGPWKAGDFSVKTPSQRYIYPIVTPSGRTVVPPPGRSWCTSVERYRTLASESRLWFGIKGDSKPQLKQFLTEVRNGRVPSSLWRYTEVGHTDTAKKELKRILDVSGRDFQTPKPVALIQRCIELISAPGDLVLDAFAGTGTTGQAVLELNQKDGGNRRFVLIESGTDGDRFCADLTVERLRRVTSGLRTNGQVVGTGGGFAFSRLAAPPGADARAALAADGLAHLLLLV